MEYIENDMYMDVLLEAQTNSVLEDPNGEKFYIWQGQQFKWPAKEIVVEGCGGCGTSKKKTYYYIDSYAVCQEDETLWGGQSLRVDGNTFIETTSKKYPPVKNDFADESSGKNTDLFTHPYYRSIPREGGLWYTDPWFTKRTE